MILNERDCLMRLSWRVGRALVLVKRLNPSPIAAQIAQILELSISDIDQILSDSESHQSQEGNVSIMTEVARKIASSVKATRHDVVTLLRVVQDARRTLYLEGTRSVVQVSYQLDAALRMIEIVLDDISLLETFIEKDGGEG